MLKLVLEREPQPVPRHDLAGMANVGNAFFQRRRAGSDTAHHRRAIQHDRPLARLLQRREQPLAILPGGKGPAVLAADGAYGKSIAFDAAQHLGVRQAALPRPHEVDATQFDRVETAGLRGDQRLLERRRVDRPEMECETAELVMHEESPRPIMDGGDKRSSGLSKAVSRCGDPCRAPVPARRRSR